MLKCEKVHGMPGQCDPVTVPQGMHFIHDWQEPGLVFQVTLAIPVAHGHWWALLFLFYILAKVAY